ncbi:MAG: hypothetical protein D6720_06765 [Gammaproteobacteria bacterium]|nr:MAG: hypothetical protein D6720_06765 [Gammaproteobacteria bacterium]
MDEAAVHCFSQRILNPFRGAMHCIRIRWGEAVTVDGRAWTLYVEGECIYQDPDDELSSDICVPDIKYGEWSRERGFQRAPVRLPTFEKTISAIGERLLKCVQERADSLPFPAADFHELWLMHGDRDLPLALLASHCDHQAREAPPLLRWTPGEAAMAHDLLLRDLHDQVASLAGNPVRTAWFDRRRHPLPEGDLNTDLIEAADDSLCALRSWQSPATLLLPLERETRLETERLAARHALRLVELLPLYPEVLQQELVTAALVEARMRQSAIDRPSPAEETLSPFYLEE